MSNEVFEYQNIQRLSTALKEAIADDTYE